VHPGSHSSRRSVLRTSLGTAAALLLGGCQPMSNQGWVRALLGLGETLSFNAQRVIRRSSELAPEFTEAEISPIFKPNGTSDPADRDYRALAKGNFADFKLVVDGLVERPGAFTLEELRELPSRTQITRHDCVEGWSCIGKWKGVRLSALIDRVGIEPQARYLVFHCADTMEQSLSGPVRYYESIDLVDARHPQTILAYEMNDRVLPIAYGAPLRLRLERQLGYKMAKYIMRIEAVDDYSKLAGGKGGYWEDRGYEWFAGI
jgi:DMSO/TMAO reductase YedYZ molybdopterin-dependent catalytic subunit